MIAPAKKVQGEAWAWAGSIMLIEPENLGARKPLGAISMIAQDQFSN